MAATKAFRDETREATRSPWQVPMGERRDGRSPAQLPNEPRPSGFRRSASSALLRGLRIAATIRCAATP